MKLFIDMDGVLCDYEGHYRRLFGVSFGMDDKERRWKNVDDVSFWSTIPWMRDGKMLWAAVQRFNPTILSAPTREQSSRKGKLIWCRRELGIVNVILETEKYKYAAPDSILIDDRPQNIDPWKANGGIGILHTSTVGTLHELGKLMGDVMPAYSQRIQSHYGV
jgi:5'-nucleotidase